MLDRKTIVDYAQDIRFWIVALFILRLFGIWLAPLEVEHNWRQTTVTMVARNFLEVDANIFLPRVDMAGEKTGITGMEFPLLNYLIFIFSKILGYQHWYGRLINLIVSSVGIWYFYLLIKRVFNQKTAFYGAFLLLGSLWFAYSRKIMPDTFSASLAIISIYYAFKFLEEKNWLSLLFYAVFGTLGLLAKLPVVFLFTYLVFPVFKGKLITPTKISFVFTSALVLAPPLYWYFIHAPYLTEHYKFWHFFMGKTFADGLEDLLEEPLAVLLRLFFTPLHLTGLIGLIGSLVYLVYKKDWQPLVIYLFGLVSFVLIVALKAGWTFHHHNYYILAFVPVFVVPIAVCLNYLGDIKVKKVKLVPVLLALFLIEGITAQMHEFRIRSHFKFILKLDEDFTELGVKPTDLVAFNSGKYPTPLYFSHRKGWTLKPSLMENPIQLQVLQNYGCKYIIILKKHFGEEQNLDLPLVVDNDDYKVYQLGLK